MALCFSRDEEVHRNAHYQIHKPILGLLDGNGMLDSSTPAPLSAVQPFLGLSAYFSPLCYLFENPQSMYGLARNMYCRLWCRMNVISQDEDCLLHVCKTFESFLMQLDMKLFIHLTKIGLPPLQVLLYCMYCIPLFSASLCAKCT